MNIYNHFENEEWRVVDEFPNYCVSNRGRVRNSKGDIMAGGYDKDGYRQVTISTYGKQYNRRICRLVAKAFIDNPLCLPCVNHIDEIKNNDDVDNLEWCTVAYNNNYGSHPSKLRKKVKCVETGVVYDGVRNAGVMNGICHQNICQCCKKPNKTAGGYHWQYVQEEINDENNAQTTN